MVKTYPAPVCHKILEDNGSKHPNARWISIVCDFFRQSSKEFSL
jgi:hypothetical protein